MGRNCTVCMHPAGSDIDAALETEEPLREIATRYGISKTALHRHWHTHAFGGSSPVASNTGTSTKAMVKSRAKTIAKWGLIAGLGLGVLAWASGRSKGGASAAVGRPNLSKIKTDHNPSSMAGVPPATAEV